jgi:hypothetical protein
VSVRGKRAAAITYLGRVALGLERAEERLLRAEDLDRARGVLAQVREAARVRDEARADALAEERGQARRARVHLLGEVARERAAVLREGHHAAREHADVQQVDLGEPGAHRAAGGVEHVLRADRVVVEDRGELWQLVLVEALLLADEERAARVLVVVGHDADELGEVVAVPLADAHRERVYVLVELVEERGGLDDHVVDPVHVELDLGARVGVAEPELRRREVARLEPAQELGCMQTHAADELERDVR